MTYDYAKPDYAKLPEQFRGGIERYIEHGIEPGHFLTAVICNDLFEAIGRADPNAAACLPALCKFFYWEAPSQCYGSRETMRAWMEARRGERARD